MSSPSFIVHCAAMKSFQKHIFRIQQCSVWSLIYDSEALFNRVSLSGPVHREKFDLFIHYCASWAPTCSKWSHWPLRVQPRTEKGHLGSHHGLKKSLEPERAEWVDSSTRTTLPGDTVGTASHKLSMSECVWVSVHAAIAWHVCGHCVSHCELARDIRNSCSPPLLRQTLWTYYSTFSNSSSSLLQFSLPPQTHRLGANLEEPVSILAPELAGPSTAVWYRQAATFICCFFGMTLLSLKLEL